MLETILLAATGKVVGSSAYDGIKAVAKKLAQMRPELEQEARQSIQSNDASRIQSVFEQVKQSLVFAADTGQIEIDGAVLNAVNQASFHHGDGFISFKNGSIEAGRISIGDQKGGSGKTVLGENMVSKSAGTSIQIGSGASIVVSGNASIQQN